MNEIIKLLIETGTKFLKVDLLKDEAHEIISKNRDKKEEVIIYKKIGKFWNQQDIFYRPDGVVIITNFRLIFIAENKKKDFISFPFEVMQNVERKKIMFVSPAIQFLALDKVFIFTFLSSSELNEIVGILKQKENKNS